MGTNVIDLINGSPETAFSFEILPPLKGNSIRKVYHVIDKLREFNPKYINITSHHSENIYKTSPDGGLQKVNIRRRPGSVAIAAAIQHRYNIPAVPHIICKGFTKEETEYALIDLHFLEVYNLLLLRGDTKKLEDHGDSHHHATDLQRQVNRFNQGIAVDDSPFQAFETPFTYGMACYPEKHEEAPNMESDMHYLRQKVQDGAQYLVTQMFFNNDKYFSFIQQCRQQGITVPIIPGIKPIVMKDQLTLLPQVFRTEIPQPLADELRKCKDDNAAAAVGTAWCVEQCRELKARGVPSIHFYTFMASDSVSQVARQIY